jgi:hypothetical protein
MAKFRRLCREYAEAYRNKLTTGKVSPEVQAKLDSCEQILDVLNIVLIRQKVEMEVSECFSFCFKEIYYKLWYQSNLAMEIMVETRYDCLVATGQCEDLLIKPLVSVESIWLLKFLGGCGNSANSVWSCR